MDEIRQALGETISYFGFRCSQLGATYATMFLTHVRAMVIDSRRSERRLVESTNSRSSAPERGLQQMMDD